MAMNQSFCFVLILAAILNAEGATRSELTAQYQKTLKSLSDLAHQKYIQATEDYDTLYARNRKSQVNVQNETQINIDLIKATLAAAIKINTGEKRACLERLQAKADQLSSIMDRCIDSEHFSALNDTKLEFLTIADVADHTIGCCQRLNPFTREDELYKQCVLEKIVDINEQINIIEQNFADQLIAVLTYVNGCLTGGAAGGFSKIGEIRYGINLCIFKPSNGD